MEQRASFTPLPLMHGIALVVMLISAGYALTGFMHPAMAFTVAAVLTFLLKDLVETTAEAVRTRRLTPTKVTSMAVGGWASEPASCLAVPSVSVMAERPKSNTPSRTRMWIRMARMISILALLPLVNGDRRS